MPARKPTPLVLAAAVLSAMLLAAGAFAGTQAVVRDRNDTAGPLDLAAASAQIRTKGKRPTLLLRLRTYETWGVAEIAQPRGSVSNFLSFEFDRNRRRPADRCLDIGVDSAGALVGQMKAPCGPVGARPLARPIRVRRPDRRRIELVVPLRLLGRSADRYAWRATSSFEARGNAPCAPAGYPPPEQRYGRCTDVTRFARLSR